MDFAKLLNKEQYSAVLHTEGAVLVSAGAGSGKTRLLTHRVAYLISQLDVAAENILAITFTNKAAGEMRDRVQKLVETGKYVTVSTFHSLCARLLRKYIAALPEYTSSFSIYTDSDKDKVLKKVYTELNITDTDIKNKIQYHISSAKNENMPIDLYTQSMGGSSLTKWIYDASILYNRYMRESNAMDFDDLMVNTYKMLVSTPDILSAVQDTYRYIHIDEFQDTNKIQYDLVRLISKKYGNVLVVGDEDQSIYGWRGANVKNLYNFQRDYAPCKIIKLEQNYRSTKCIIDHANRLIKNNIERINKTLYTDNAAGDAVEFYSAYDEQDEAEYISRQILFLQRNGVSLNEMAILMRINAFSRPFEEKLLSYNIPHKIYGGFKFYERAEVKNVLSYMTAMVNPKDEQNLLRIINFPKRGIGATSIEKMLSTAQSSHVSLREVIDNNEKYNLDNAIVRKVLPLANILRTLSESVDCLTLPELTEQIIQLTGILVTYSSDEDAERKLNVLSLIQSIKEYNEANPESKLTDYLESVTLISDINTSDDTQMVTIASVHSAKGLEFDHVFVVGCEEGYFPISRNGDADIEEERRLMYVAATRARKRLFCTVSRSRYLYTKREVSLPSRFLKEMGLIVERPRLDSSSRESNYVRANTFRAVTPQANTDRLSRDEAVVGLAVYHPHFGKGVISNTAEVANNGSVVIAFESFGSKTLSLDYAPIKKI